MYEFKLSSIPTIKLKAEELAWSFQNRKDKVSHLRFTNSSKLVVARTYFCLAYFDSMNAKATRILENVKSKFSFLLMPATFGFLAEIKCSTVLTHAIFKQFS